MTYFIVALIIIQALQILSGMRTDPRYNKNWFEDYQKREEKNRKRIEKLKNRFSKK